MFVLDRTPRRDGVRGMALLKDIVVTDVACNTKSTSLYLVDSLFVLLSFTERDVAPW